MKSIYASKLYKASTRKDRIHAAIIAPSNLALVQQLADDLDEPYQTPENLGTVKEKPESESTESEAEDELIVDEEINPETDLVTIDDIKSLSSKPSSHSAPKHSSPSGGPSSAPEGEDKPDKPETDTSNLMPESPANEKPQPAEASTKIKATTVADLSVLKNTLNSREDTTGVTRIAEKENEVWIYYNDDTNLNNIMTDVIECLMNSGYESFEFNRLARSDNAIVFVTMKTTEETPESVSLPE